MKAKLKLILFFCTSLFSSPVISQTAAPAKTLPPPYVMRQPKTDISHLALDLKFDWERKQAYGSCKINFTMKNVGNKITLDAGRLTINSVVSENGTPLAFRYDGGDKDDGLEITLQRQYNTNEKASVTIDYRTNYVNESDPNNLGGSLGKGLRFIAPTKVTPTIRKQIWSSGQPQSNRYWFPSYDDLNDLRTTEITITTEKPLMAIANGTWVSTKDNADGSRTFHYKTETPHANYLTALVVGEYVDVPLKLEKTTLHTFGYPDEKEAIQATIERLPEMFKFFSQETATAYPYNDYSQIMVQDYPFPGMVGQHTAAIVSDNMIDDDRTHADFFYLWDGVEAQTLASQWFGNLLQPKTWKDFWLNESFSHYFDGLYNYHRNGPEEYLTYYLTFDHSLVFGDWNAGYRRPIVTDHFADLAAHTSDNYNKTRGALVLRMLRKEIGEPNWRKFLTYYISENSNKQVATSDFEKAVEKAAGKKMDWFFDQWLYKVGHPVFEVSKTYDTNKKQLVLSVKQVQQPNPEEVYPQNDYFQGNVDIEIDGETQTVRLEAKAENQFTFAVKKDPKLVHFDCENTWIKEMTFEKTIEEWCYQLENDEDITGKMAALTALADLARNEKTLPSDKNKILAAFRKTVSGKSYWRFRASALIQLRNLQTAPYDAETIALLLKTIKEETSWLKAWSIGFLGLTKDPKYDEVYLQALNNQSDRVINAAAIALGKSKSTKAFDALVKLKDKPSWKSQSLISCLNGLKELGDPRGTDIAIAALNDIHSPRWWLATPIWDYPVAAIDTVIALGKSDSVYPLVEERFNMALQENEVNVIFSQLLLLCKLGNPKSKPLFEKLKTKFREDTNAMNAITTYENQWQEVQKNKKL